MNIAEKGRIYLDCNATTPLRSAAREALCAALSKNYGNPSSVHAEGRAARGLVESAREEVAALVGSPPENVIFNSGATEGNNTVIRHFAARGRVLVSAIEHPSVREAAEGLERIPVTSRGIVDLQALETLCESGPPPALISVMLANNETGVLQPLSDIVARAGRRNIPVHCDAAQGAGRVPIAIGALGVDLLTFSAHKIGGAAGAGALVMGGCAPPPVLLRGGGQERMGRAGTENLPALAAFGAAACEARGDLGAYGARVAALRDTLESEIAAFAPDTVFFGRESPRLPNTSLFALPGLSAQVALMRLDLEGLAVSNGSACSSGVVKASPVLRAMGVGEALASCALRVSLGPANTQNDIARFVEVWKTIARRQG